MPNNNDIQGLRRFNFLINIHDWVILIVMGGIVVFWDVRVFAWVEGGNFVGLLRNFSYGFGEGRL
jgi:hypothetical protein